MSFRNRPTARSAISACAGALVARRILLVATSLFHGTMDASFLHMFVGGDLRIDEPSLHPDGNGHPGHEERHEKQREKENIQCRRHGKVF